MNSLKKIKEWLNTFTPFNEQEQVDCQHIRQFLEEEPNRRRRTCAGGGLHDSCAAARSAGSGADGLS